MTDRYHDGDEPCLAFVCEHATYDQTVLASATIARAADAMRRARGLRPRGEPPALFARARALRTPDLAAALAAEGLPAPRARALAAPRPVPSAVVHL